MADLPPDPPFLEVEQLVAHYGPVKVLDGVSLRIGRGEIFVIIGSSGCGKSTLLKHMCGLLRPTSGAIRYASRDITSMDEEQLGEIQRGIGIAFQASGLINSMTVGDNVALPLREYGHMPEELVEATVRIKLGLVGLASSQYKMPSDLSGGMKKRAGLARAIALDPPIVYFDEPSAGLDPITASGLDELILDLRAQFGITVIIVTHELDSIRRLADRILMLEKGEVIFDGTLAQAESSNVPRLRQFMERRPDDVIAQRT